MIFLSKRRSIISQQCAKVSRIRSIRVCSFRPESTFWKCHFRAFHPSNRRLISRSTSLPTFKDICGWCSKRFYVSLFLLPLLSLSLSSSVMVLFTNAILFRIPFSLNPDSGRMRIRVIDLSWNFTPAIPPEFLSSKTLVLFSSRLFSFPNKLDKKERPNEKRREIKKSARRKEIGQKDAIKGEHPSF